MPKVNSSKDLVNLLISARRSRGLTQNSIAAVLDSTPASICLIESGQRAIKIDTVLSYCRALGLSLYVQLKDNNADSNTDTSVTDNNTQLIYGFRNDLTG